MISLAACPFPAVPGAPVCVASRCSGVEPLRLTGLVDVGAVRDECLDRSWAAKADRMMQGGHAVLVGGVDIGSSLKQHQQLLPLIGLDQDRARSKYQTIRLCIRRARFIASLRMTMATHKNIDRPNSASRLPNTGRSMMHSIVRYYVRSFTNLSGERPERPLPATANSTSVEGSGINGSPTDFRNETDYEFLLGDEGDRCLARSCSRAYC